MASNSNDQADHEYIWLEITNARVSSRSGSATLEVQLRGDRAEPRPRWWRVHAKALGKNLEETRNELFRALDKKRIVLGALQEENKSLICQQIRIQFSESDSY